MILFPYSNSPKILLTPLPTQLHGFFSISKTRSFKKLNLISNKTDSKRRGRKSIKIKNKQNKIKSTYQIQEVHFVLVNYCCGWGLSYCVSYILYWKKMNFSVFSRCQFQIAFKSYIYLTKMF